MQNKENHVAADAVTDEVDVEQFAKEGKPVPKAKHYRIRVDDQTYVVDKPKLNGREILETAGKNPPEKFILTEKIRGKGVRTIGLNDIVDLTEPGVERFRNVKT